MRFLKRLLIGLVLLIAAFAAVVALQPDDYRLTRQIAIAAPASAIFPHVNDLRQWEDWSPWAKLDPNACWAIVKPSPMDMTTASPASGVSGRGAWILSQSQ